MKKKEIIGPIVDVSGQAANLIKPGAGTVVSTGKSIAALVFPSLAQRSERRLRRFVDLAIEGDLDDEQKDKAMLAKIQAYGSDEWINLLRYMLQDDENEKVPIYADLFEAVIEGQLPREDLRDVIRACSMLALHDLTELCRLVPIFRTSEKSHPGAVDRLASEQRLISAGAFYPKDGTKEPHPSELGELIADKLGHAIGQAVAEKA